MSTSTTPPHIVWGRCKGGGRWFWTAHIVSGEERHGWAANSREAARKANRAAVLLAAGQYASIRIDDEAAKTRFAAAEQTKQDKAQAKAKAEKQRHDTAGEGLANLYAIEYGYFDHGTRQWVHSKVVRLPVTKMTPKRIYFLRSSEPGEFETGYVDRRQMESQGWVWSSRYSKICAAPPKLPNDKPFIPPPFRPEYPRTAACSPADLKRLKAEMRNAHPDVGGTDAAFIAARRRYVDAKRLMETR